MDSAAEGDCSAGGDAHVGGVYHRLVGERDGHGGVDVDAPVIRIRHVKARPIPRQRGGRVHGIGCVACLIDGAALLAENDIGGEGVLVRNLLVLQHAIVAAIGDKQPRAVGERKARKVQGVTAGTRIGRGIVGIRAVRYGAKHRSFHVGGSGRGRRSPAVSVIRHGTDHVRLADLHIGRYAVAGGYRIPDQHPVVTEVGNEHVRAIGSDRDRVQHVGGGGAGGLVRHGGCVIGGEVGKTHHDVGRFAVGGGDGIPDQHPVVLRIRDEQLAVLDPHALRPAQRCRGRWCSQGQRLPVGEIRLPHHHVRRSIAVSGQVIPDQHAVVVRVRHHQVDAIGCHCRWQVQIILAGNGIDRVGNEIRLAQHQGCGPHADRARGQVGQFGVRFGQLTGDVLEHQHAVVDRRGSHNIGIRHEKGVGRECDAVSRADHRVAGIGVGSGERYLADDGAGGLPVHEIGGV